ncbi:MAG TPA: hypothetical protein QF604_03805 [Candidatus Latescibacteria bacterium]|nr:hypothetical protein [Candidatus Latescibacterota bacterium]MEE3041936.1 hypothetical protein [Candidatus Latescibacterota bacterium]MEE3262930.1 hypothetical protein [Candidatus Latescibacterota bacterium]MEE3336636.1 hypothetical protein [Candidatus Latescibacterota bacterium]HJN27020.1 hypothetical protein [Candidatus Latescibacterota bacterium]
MDATTPYPATVEVDYPDRELSRLSTFFRLIYAIPVFIILSFLSGPGTQVRESSVSTGLGLGAGLYMATLLMILFRQKYPRW